MLSLIAHLLGKRLRVGDRVRLYGGHAEQPKWLSGSTGYRGECTAFIPGEQPQPAAVIRLDTPITFDGVTGHFVALRLRYVGARWSKQEVVHIELYTQPPSDVRDQAGRGLWIESHASYRVEDPDSSFMPNILRGPA
jgi:hypothetical protein